MYHYFRYIFTTVQLQLGNLVFNRENVRHSGDTVFADWSNLQEMIQLPPPHQPCHPALASSAELIRHRHHHNLQTRWAASQSHLFQSRARRQAASQARPAFPELIRDPMVKVSKSSLFEVINSSPDWPESKPWTMAGTVFSV